MGKGLALTFKRAFPPMFDAYLDAYLAACQAGELTPGRMHIWRNPAAPPRYVINFPTKRHWRSKSRLEDIEAGLLDLVRVAKERELESMAIPALGAGLGGLPWDAVQASITRTLGRLEGVEVFLYGPK